MCKECGSQIVGLRADAVFCGKKCREKAQRRRDKQRHLDYYHANKKRQKDRTLLRKYGITLDEYNQMMVYQSDRCATCLTDDKGGKQYWLVDHDHATGKVRGLLCTRCNSMLGQALDDPDTLRAAASYLEVSGV